MKNFTDVRHTALADGGALSASVNPIEFCDQTETENTEERFSGITGFVSAGQMIHDTQALIPLTRDDRGLVSRLPCLSVLELNQTFDMNARCPSECPYHALAPDLGFCSAACVRPSSCAAFNPDAPVEDASRGICRGAQVDGLSLSLIS